LPSSLEFTGCKGSSGPGYIRANLLGKSVRYAPDRTADATHVYIDLKIDPRRETAEGFCETTLRAFRDGVKTVDFDAMDLKISEILQDGKRAAYSLKNGKLTVKLPRTLRAREQSVIRVRYRLAKPKSGLHFVKSPAQVWSQSQPEDARYWFPCHDAPQEKATSEARITVPDGFTAVSNGDLLRKETKSGWTSWHWRLDQPHSIYLISVAVGRFSEIKDEWDGIPVLYYCEQGREEDARRGFAKTTKAMAFFSEETGVRYPYSKYAQVAVAEYPGGMEHTTCTTQTDACLIDRRAGLDTDLDLLVAHELAHQWFGDLVTCREWSHAWLNEGFATYFEVLFQAHDKGIDEADYEMHVNARAYIDEDTRRYRRPIVCTSYKEPWTLFDRHLYEKGAWVLHMLRSELGVDLWRKSIKHYLEKHRDGSVETLDLIQAIEETTGRNMRPFFDQWVHRAGYPQLRAHYNWDSKSRKVEVIVQQAQDVSDDNPAFKLPLEIRLSGRGWERVEKAPLKDKEHVFTFKVPSEPLDVELDPRHVLLAKTTLVKPLSMWRRQLASAPSGLSRLKAAAHLARWGDAAAVAQLERSARNDRFWAAAAEAARALGTIGTDAAFISLKRLLKTRSPKVRRAVVESLGRFNRPDAVAAILPLARRDPSVHVEAEAARALGAQRDSKLFGLLKQKLESTSYRQVVSAGALAGLAALREPRLIPLFRKAAKRPYGFATRAQALRALGEYASLDSSVFKDLEAAVSDDDERLGLTALAILGQLENPKSVPLLEKTLKTSANTRLRVYAEEALARVRRK
jgi:aminopeptidase N